MDVFKLAFETTIVGLLTFVWLGLAAYLVFPDFLNDSFARIDSKVVKGYQAAIGVGVLTLAYCLGSAILPIADQLVNDEHWPLNENGIRCQVLVAQEKQLEKAATLPKEQTPLLSELEPCHCSHWASLFAGHKDNPSCAKQEAWRIRQLVAPFPWEAGEDEDRNSDKNKQERILTLFQQQETSVMNQAPDKTELLRQLHERIVVLRGAVFSGSIVLLICLTAYFTRVNGDASHWKHRVRQVCGGIIGLIFFVFALLNGYQDLMNRNIFDIPVLESLLLVITVFGFYLMFKGVRTALFRTKRYVLIVLFFTGLAYGGWMWSEILYDQQVISSFVILQNTPLCRQTQ